MCEVEERRNQRKHAFLPSSISDLQPWQALYITPLYTAKHEQGHIS
jgi:hypothetical protein